MVKHIKDIIGSHVAISPSKASLLYNDFLTVLKSSSNVQYSFEGIQDCSSAFCNASIGKLYMNSNPSDIESKISFCGFNGEDVWLDKVKKATLLGREEKYRKSNEQALEAILV